MAYFVLIHILHGNYSGFRQIKKPAPFYVDIQYIFNINIDKLFLIIN